MLVVMPGSVGSPLFDHSEETSNLLILVEGLLSPFFIEYPLTWVERGLSELRYFEKVLCELRTNKYRLAKKQQSSEGREA